MESRRARMTVDTQSRISSFRGCGVDVRPIALAKAGFSFHSTSRKVRCGSCGLVLDPTVRDPLRVHEQLAPRCIYLNSLQSSPNMDPRATFSAGARGNTLSTIHNKGFGKTSVEPQSLREPSETSNPRLSRTEATGGAATAFQPRLERSTVERKRRKPDREFLLEMRDEFRRLETYYDFPNNDSERIEDLAAAGFFYQGYFDNVQCAFCTLVLKEWESSDIPAAQHRKHSPNCPFVRGVPAETELLLSGEKSPSLEKGVSKSWPQNIIVEVPPTSLPQEPQYASEEARLASYLDWTSSVQRPRQLAKAGFYHYAGRDVVKCFHCGGILSDWEKTDEPLNEHRRWFPGCERAQQCSEKSLPMSSASVTRAAASHTSSPRSSSSSSSSSSLSSRPNNYDELVHSYETLVESMQCVICMDAENNVLFMPCGHMACSDCATQLKQCHICRQRISSTVDCFMS